MKYSCETSKLLHFCKWQPIYFVFEHVEHTFFSSSSSFPDQMYIYKWIFLIFDSNTHTTFGIEIIKKNDCVWFQSAFVSVYLANVLDRPMFWGYSPNLHIMKCFARTKKASNNVMNVRLNKFGRWSISNICLLNCGLDNVPFSSLYAHIIRIHN